MRRLHAIVLFAMLGAACSYDWTVPAPGAPCSPAGGCPPDQFCEFADKACGAHVPQGQCTPRAACPPSAPSSPVCGCGNRTMGNVCEARANGVDVSSEGKCAPPPPPGTFYPCGYVFCRTSQEACVQTNSPGRPSDFSCRPCASNTCDCAGPCKCDLIGGIVHLTCGP